MVKVKIKVLAARGLSMDGDSFVKLKLGESKCKTKVIKRTSNPDFGGEIFEMSGKDKDSLTLELNHTKKVGPKGDKLGVASIPLTGLSQGKETVSWQMLSNGAEVQIGITAESSATTLATSSSLPNASQFERGRAATLYPTSSAGPILPPIPSESEVNRQYEQVMASLGFDSSFKHPTQYQKGIINDISTEKKWAMVCQHKSIQTTKTTGKIEMTPQYWTTKLKSEPQTTLLRDLRIVLGGEDLKWIGSFVSAGGLESLLDILASLEHQLNRPTSSANPTLKKKDDELISQQTECIRCVLALMNNKAGMAGVLKGDKPIKRLVLCMTSPEDIRIKLLRGLAVVCLSMEGHKRVIDGFIAFKNLKKEKARFETLVNYLKTTTDPEAQLAYLTFINALINAPEDLEVREEFRSEFKNLGMEEILKALKEKLNPEKDFDLETQIDTYEEEGRGDQRELEKRFEDIQVDMNSPKDIFDWLLTETQKMQLSPQMLGVLRDLLLMFLRSANPDMGAKTFLAACRLVRQISLNKSQIGVEGAHVNIADLLEHASSDLGKAPLTSKIAALELELKKYKKFVETSEIELREKDEKIGTLKAGGGEAPPPPEGGPPPPPPPGAPPAPGEEEGSGGPPPPPPPDGPPPPPGGPPPPPPPGGGPPPPPGMGPAARKIPKRKPLKAPTSKMKGLQWNKIPENKIKGTVFEKFSMEYKGFKIDYSGIQENFAAKVIEAKPVEEKKPAVVQILDPKTWQAISLFLAQFKTVPLPDIAAGLRDLDTKMFTPEQVKVISTCLPSKEDVGAIKSYLQDGGEDSKLPIPEKFALELDKVSNLDQRLFAFNFLANFGVKKSDIKPGLETLKQAAIEVLNSQKIPQLLEVILEVGNFLNEGTPRGNLQAFKLSSIGKMNDTKSTDNQMTLLQYLVKILEKSAPELLQIREELSRSEGASKISFPTIQSDVASLQKDFATVQKNMENFKEGEKFTTTMKNFINRVKDDVEGIQKSFNVTDEKLKEAYTFFGEDPKSTSPEEFFAMFGNFAKCIEDSVKANAEAILNEEKNRRREEAKLKREADLQGKKRTTAANQDSVVDELFGALKGGNYFKTRRGDPKSDPANVLLSTSNSSLSSTGSSNPTSPTLFSPSNPRLKSPPIPSAESKQRANTTFQMPALKKVETVKKP
eukprot:TRINITY_DN6052_c0_g1_i1.p1 TRINITY_DN6052_c0_g1~~TRINITY_DN6052_c0_g1_i1.p1  ORF type:complete len:1166 (-),score=432.81 TRINITY_DN6052_c0_g1_i1:21-3518(-)